MSRTLSAIWITIALLTALAGPAFAQKRLGLVIGNNDYRNVPNLVTAVNDARAVGEALRSIGFAVKLGENLSLAGMHAKLAAFRDSVVPGDVAFFFFAGHGFAVGGRNFLLPVDVPAVIEGQESKIVEASLEADVAIGVLLARDARVAIMVLDACRDNPFSGLRRRSVGLTSVVPPSNGFVLFSAGIGQRALDGLDADDQNPNSVFTRHFVRELKKPDRTMVQIAKSTQAAVRRAARTVMHAQMPSYYDQIVTDVVLQRSASAP